MITKTIITYYY